MPMLRIATRKSQLARWQSEYVAAAIQRLDPEIKIEYVLITSEGDRVQNQSLTEIGGKALFVKALEQALLDDVADIAVHSVKDMSAVLAEGMSLVAMMPRADVRDAYCHASNIPLDQLAAGAVIGTASPRRMCQIKHAYPHLQCALLRGNIQTRIQKLQSESYDATLLASAGLLRMGLQERM